VKEKYFWMVIIVILISWIGNYTYFQSKQLDEPIFLKHYYESYIPKEENVQLTFYYLVNKQSPANVQYVKIDGIEFYPIENGLTSSLDEQNEQEFRHQYLKSVTISFPRIYIPITADSNKPWTFEKMEVGFDASQAITVDIGKVAFFNDPKFESPFKFQMSSSSNDHHEEYEIIATEKAVVEKINSPFSEVAKDVVIKVNTPQKRLNDKEMPEWFKDGMRTNWKDVQGGSFLHKKLFPLNLEKDEWIRVMTFINPNQHSYLQYNLKIHGKTTNGQPFTSLIPINDQPYFEQKDIDEIIEAQGGDK
jgi:hypothetical protein